VTKWREWILTTVAAVGGAYILGVTAPVRAASVVTYTLENVQLQNGDDVTGSLTLSLGTQDYISAVNLTVSDAGSTVDEYTSVIASNAGTYIGVGDIYNDSASILLVSDLTGAAGEDVAFATPTSELYLPDYGVDHLLQGSVSDGSAGPSSVPEPSSIMATVTAVTLGVVLRRMKRKV